MRLADGPQNGAMKKNIGISVVLAVIAILMCAGCRSFQEQAETSFLYDDSVQKLKTIEPAGATAILFDKNGILMEINAGYANIEHKTPFNGSTRVSIGDLSEIIISILVMQLAEQGKIDIDTPFRNYSNIGGTRTESPSGLRIQESTIREMLYHGTGIRANYALTLKGYNPATQLNLLLRQAPVIREAGTARIQSSALFDMLGLFLASLEQDDLGTYSKRHLFDFLCMRSASYGPTDNDVLYAAHYKYGAPLSEPEDPPAPSKAFVADSYDLVRLFSIFFEKDDDEIRKSILSRSSIEDMISSQSAAIERNQGYRVGLPWLLGPSELSYIGQGVWYSGKYIAHRACVILLPEKGIGALAVTNSWAWDANETLYAVCTSLLAQYAKKVLGIYRPPSSPLLQESEIPENIQSWIEGNYASDLGLIKIRVAGKKLLATYSGITSEFSYIPNEGFVAGNRMFDIRRIQPAGNSLIDLQFSSGFISFSCNKIPEYSYPTAWRSLPGTYRRNTADTALPYALTIRVEDGIYLVSGDDGREYVLLPEIDGRAKIVCNESSVFWGNALIPCGPESIKVGECQYNQ